MKNAEKVGMIKFDFLGLKTLTVIDKAVAVSYTHLRAHETVLDLVCRLLLEKNNTTRKQKHH